eukprot:930400-Prorocentrum_lima.AAC.1
MESVAGTQAECEKIGDLEVPVAEEIRGFWTLPSTGIPKDCYQRRTWERWGEVILEMDLKELH